MPCNDGMIGRVPRAMKNHINSVKYGEIHLYTIFYFHGIIIVMKFSLLAC